MRLTKKEEPPKVPCYVEIQEEHWKTKHRQQAIDKLGQLEDIEDELGIDLITLFKALKQKYIYVLLEGEKINMSFEYSLEQNGGFYYWWCEEDDICHYYEIKDYGKTWALTKGELK